MEERDSGELISHVDKNYLQCFFARVADEVELFDKVVAALVNSFFDFALVVNLLEFVSPFSLLSYRFDLFEFKFI